MVKLIYENGHFYKRRNGKLIQVNKYGIPINKADQISLIVKGRGYGISFPRTVYPFLPLHWYDLIIIIFALILFVLTHFYVTI